MRYIDPDGREWKEGWQYLRQSFSARISIGMQAGARVDVGEFKVGAGINFVSKDIIKIDGNAADKISSGDIRQSVDLSVGIVSLSKEQVLHDNGDNTITRTTTTGATVFGVGGSQTKTDVINENRDGSYAIDGNKTDVKTDIEIPGIEIDAKAIVGVEVKVDTELLIKGLDEIFKGNTSE